MADRDDFLAELRHWHDGTSWHGASLASQLDDVDALTASLRLVRGAPTIWEVVLHVTAWTGEVARRLRGAPPALPLDGDWPTAPALVTAPAWAAAQARLAVAHADLIAAVHALPAERLGDRVGDGRRGSTAAISCRALIIGALRLESHHAGQVTILKIAARRLPPVRAGCGKQA